MTRRAAAFTTAGVIAVLAASPLLRPLWRERRLQAAPRPLDVVLVTLDTTRADRLGCYGGKAAASPRLDQLAEKGVRFRRAYAHVPLTAPSHSSLLTGLLPPRHGVRDNGGYVLRDGVATLAEQFVEAGYRTGAFVSAFVLDRRFGLARGFGTYEDDVLSQQEDQTLASIRAEVTVGRALEWLRADDPRPVFLWVHLYDPHYPYEPPEPFASRFKASPYEGEIAYADEQAGRLLDAVAARGRPALVVAVGDHGESLGEHQELTHSYFIYEGTQHVPLILSLPGFLPEGATVEPVVREVDLMPTILDIAGLAIPHGLDGRSLVPLITTHTTREPGPAYLESYHPRFWWGARELIGLRTGRWLFIQSPRPELYDVDRDPAAVVNVAAQQPQEMERLRAALASYAGSEDPSKGRTATDAETAGRLRALGYVGSPIADAPATTAELPDAKDNAPLLATYSTAEDLVAKGRPAEALEAYRKALAINPRSVTVRLSVANTLLDLGRPAEAFQEFAELALHHPEEPAHVQGMARCLARQGRRKEALALLQPAAARFPDATLLREDLAAVLQDSGRTVEAEAELRGVTERAPRLLAPRLRLADLQARRGMARDAASGYLKVLELSPRSDEGRRAVTALVPLADRLLDAGELVQAQKAYRGALEAGAVGGEALYLNLALVSYRLGRHDESLAVLQRGLTASPGSARLHYRAGRILDAMGRHAEAEGHYRRALELDGASDEATQARDALARLQRSR